jgi:hypothetical protein
MNGKNYKTRSSILITRYYIYNSDNTKTGDTGRTHSRMDRKEGDKKFLP